MYFEVGNFRVISKGNRKIYLEKLCKKKVEPNTELKGPPYHWKRIGNYTSLEAAFVGLLEAKLTDSDAHDVQTILNEIRELKTEAIKVIRKGFVRLAIQSGRRIQSGTKAVF
jgi:hypothetical protein